MNSSWLVGLVYSAFLAGLKSAKDLTKEDILITIAQLEKMRDDVVDPTPTMGDSSAIAFERYLNSWYCNNDANATMKINQSINNYLNSWSCRCDKEVNNNET